MEKEISLFDSELENKDIVQVVRSNKRRGAIIIPKNIGAEIAKKITEQMDQDQKLKTKLQNNLKSA